MQKLVKYSLALQLAVAGVAVAQVQTNQGVNTGRADQNTNVGTIDNRTGMQQDNNNRTDRLAPAGTVRASKLIGMEVYNQQDKHLGEIKDIVLDQNQKKIGYVVLSYGGIAGLGDKLFALPRNMIQVHTEGRNKAVVSLDEQTLKNAPGFDANRWPTEANADYYKNLDKYYGQHGGDRLTQHDQKTMRDVADKQGHSVHNSAGDVDADARTAGDRLDQAADRTGDNLKDAGDKTVDTLKDAGRKTGDALSRTGDKISDTWQDNDHTSAQPAAGQVGVDNSGVQWNRRVSQLIGANVKSPQDENLGEVYDVLLDLQAGQVRYAVLSYGGILGMGDKLFAVPMDQFQARDNNLVLSINKDQLKNAPGFDQNKWPDTANNQWSQSVDQYYRQHGSQNRGNTGDLNR